MIEIIDFPKIKFSDFLGLIISLLTTVFAAVIGIIQLRINHRLKQLEDYVAVNIAPEQNNVIRVMNVGVVNVYIHKFEIPGNVHYFKKPRLIPARTDQAYYWLPQPPVNSLQDQGEGLIKLYLTDEFNKKYIFTGGIRKDVKKETITYVVWSYKTEKINWLI